MAARKTTRQSATANGHVKQIQSSGHGSKPGDWLITVGALVLIAVTLLSFAGRLWWRFDLLSNFRAQLCALSLVWVGLLIWQRHPRYAAVLTGAFILNGIPVAQYISAATNPVTASVGQVLDVMSANLLWHNDQYGAFLDIVEARDPDVIVTLELTPAWKRGLASLDKLYAYKLLVPSTNPYGIGIWSRYPLNATKVPLEGTLAIDATLATPHGKVRLVGVHLRAPTNAAKAAERDRQFGDLATLTHNVALPLAVVGDFNSTRYSPYFSSWLKSADLRDIHGPFSITWPTALPIVGIAIDHCAVNRKIDAASFRRLRAFGSDHYPILCRINLDNRHD